VLYIVLILVLAALGLLVTALITANSLWAWVSIALSVLAGLVLVADFVRRRSARRRAERAVATRVDAEPVEESEDAAEVVEPAELRPVTGELGGDQAQVVETGDPAEEATAPADAELVAKLDAEVVVVDEYPRYHVPECPWLGDRDTIPISVKEARDLGFTPCARCTPDAKLVAAARAKAKSRG
jgi:hypothetical protein